RLVDDREIVADARAADADAEFERAFLQRENEFVRRHARPVFLVAGKIIARRVDGVEARLRAEFRERDQAQRALARNAELLRERVGVARHLERGAAHALDRLDRGEYCRAAEAGGRERKQRGAFEKIATGKSKGHGAERGLTKKVIAAPKP